MLYVSFVKNEIYQIGHYYKHDFRVQFGSMGYDMIEYRLAEYSSY